MKHLDLHAEAPHLASDILWLQVLLARLAAFLCMSPNARAMAMLPMLTHHFVRGPALSRALHTKRKAHASRDFR